MTLICASTHCEASQMVHFTRAHGHKAAPHRQERCDCTRRQLPRTTCGNYERRVSSCPTVLTKISTCPRQNTCLATRFPMPRGSACLCIRSPEPTHRVGHPQKHFSLYSSIYYRRTSVLSSRTRVHPRVSCRVFVRLGS